MTLRTLYAILAAVGAIASLVCFVPWTLENGLDLRLMLRLLTANSITIFFAVDVVLAALVVIVFAGRSGRRGLRLWWLPVLGTIALGVSFGLPLLLFLREHAKRTDKRYTGRI